MSQLTPDTLNEIRDRMQHGVILREGEGRAKIVVHMGTCGIASGAKEILTAFKAEIEVGNVHQRLVGGRVRYAEIIDRVDRMMRGESSHGRVTMEITTEHWSRALEMELVQQGALPERGFLKQEDIPLEPFLATRTGRLFGEDA